ncbi:MAG: GNAT family N-acetyltransferase [Cyanobacteria bacterium NC_groundwater_1444_Ag_S-0.65um_54_12]|nr:GNAT family N-acetyltransferase [Cyanobacteria bacterium NC_groundwater_1444_Ag_S-0.65um_54_12]
MIRQHQSTDRPALLALLELGMKETYPDLCSLPPASLQRRVADEFAHYYGIHSKIIWIADSNSQVAGCLWTMKSFHPVTDLADLFIVNVGVFPAFRKRGLARQLFGTAISYASEHGLARIRLFVNPANISAYRLYEQLGFSPQTHEMCLSL